MFHFVELDYRNPYNIIRCVSRVVDESVMKKYGGMSNTGVDNNVCKDTNTKVFKLLFFNKCESLLFSLSYNQSCLYNKII